MIVQCNRTESLDASHNEILQGKIELPRESEIVKTFAEQLHNVAKKLQEDEETGSKRYVYVKLGPDHFRHAFNYEAMAFQAQALGYTGLLDYYAGIPGRKTFKAGQLTFRAPANLSPGSILQLRDGTQIGIPESGEISVSKEFENDLKGMGFVPV